ncbi:MAG: 50S ribosomal protein L10 [Micrococcaceae bacterium]|nr:50S ribosomal protein L10 [Micrococcaceae bacterium]
MANAEKTAAVDELTELFRNSSAAVVTEYRGLTVEEITTLRRSLGENATYAVAKNTLTAIAAEKAGITALEGKLTGPTAIAFVSGETVDVAKTVRDFAKAHDKLVIKGGYMDGEALDEADVHQLADLESREVLLSMMAGAMKGSLSKAAATFQAPIEKAVRLAEALREKQDQAA